MHPKISDHPTVNDAVPENRMLSPSSPNKEHYAGTWFDSQERRLPLIRYCCQSLMMPRRGPQQGLSILADAIKTSCLQVKSLPPRDPSSQSKPSLVTGSVTAYTSVTRQFIKSAVLYVGQDARIEVATALTARDCHENRPDRNMQNTINACPDRAWSASEINRLNQ
jgi:hypothetical protein